MAYLNELAKNVALDAVNTIIVDGKTISEWIEEIKARRWISVKDRLPENGKMAICKTDWFYEVCQWDARSEVWFSSSHIHTKDYVTHWMPLPEPPKEEA